MCSPRFQEGTTATQPSRGCIAPVALFEAPDPMKKAMYCKHLVYAMNNTEFSFEELRWLNDRIHGAELKCEQRRQEIWNLLLWLDQIKQERSEMQVQMDNLRRECMSTKGYLQQTDHNKNLYDLPGRDSLGSVRVGPFASTPLPHHRAFFKEEDQHTDKPIRGPAPSPFKSVVSQIPGKANRGVTLSSIKDRSHCLSGLYRTTSIGDPGPRCPDVTYVKTPAALFIRTATGLLTVDELDETNPGGLTDS